MSITISAGAALVYSCFCWLCNAPYFPLNHTDPYDLMPEIVIECLTMCIMLGKFATWFKPYKKLHFPLIFCLSCKQPSTADSDGKPRGSIFTVLVLVSVLKLTLSVSVLVLVLPLLSWSCASRPRQFKAPVKKRHQPTDPHQKPSWQSTWQWQWSIVRTFTEMNNQPFIPSAVCGHSLEVMVCLLLLHW